MCYLFRKLESLTLMLFLNRQSSKSKLRKFYLLGGLDILRIELSNISLVRTFFDFPDVSSKVPYYLFFLLLVVMSIVSLVETHRLLQHDLVVCSEAHQDKWATNDHDCSPNHYAKNK